MTGSILVAIGSGGFVGFLLGLMGGGGSVLATPLLLYAVGVPSPHIAIGTGALAVSVNAFANLISHAIKGHVWWRCAAVFAGVGTLGALAGSSPGKAMDGQRLLFLLGLAMIGVAASMLKPRKAAPSTSAVIDWRMCLHTGIAAFLAGTASGFFGIGGGVLVVPALLATTGMPMINAVGSSLLAVSAFGLATALNYAGPGLIDWPLAAEFIGGGMVGGVLGMLLSTRLSTRKSVLNRIFAVVIFAVAAYVLWCGSIA